MELLAHTIALLPYQSLDGPLYAIHLVANQVPMLGTIALQGIDELVHHCDDDGEGKAGMAASAVIRESANGRPDDVVSLVEARGGEGRVGVGGEEEGKTQPRMHGGRDGCGPKQRSTVRQGPGISDTARADVLKASSCKAMAAALMLHLANYLKSAYGLSDAKVRGFKADGPIGAREASVTEVRIARPPGGGALVLSGAGSNELPPLTRTLLHTIHPSAG